MVSKANKQLLMEGLGTFALCYIGGWAGEGTEQQSANLTGVALAHALVLGLFVYLGASISGGHYNPAVSISLFVTGHQKLEDTIKYILAQFGGSILAGIALYALRPHWQKEIPMATNTLRMGHPSLAPGVEPIHGLIFEAIATGTLVLCVFSAGVHRKASDATVGFMVGCSLLIGVLSIGNLTGAALNPARVLGPAIITGKVAEKGHMIYYFGPIIGGLVTSKTYDYFFIKGMGRQTKRIDDKTELPYLEN